MKTRTIAAMIMMMQGSCTTAALKVPAGTYLSTDGQEAVTSSQAGLGFRIRLGSGELMTRGPYEYELTSRGEILVYGSSNDRVFVFGVIDYDWQWDGKAIARTKRYTAGSPAVMYSRQE